MHGLYRGNARMRTTAVRIALVALILALGCGPALAQSLRIHGSNAVGERLMPALVEACWASRGTAACAASQRRWTS